MNRSLLIKLLLERLVFSPGMTSQTNSFIKPQAVGRRQSYRARGQVPLCISHIGGISMDYDVDARF